MRYMVLIKATPESEAGQMPSTELLNAMGKFNQELLDAGILVDGNGLAPSSKGARVRITPDKRTVIDGPFAETKELVSGYWIWEVRSLDEAIEWVKRMPAPMPNDPESEVEIRKVFEPADFGEVFTPEMQAKEQELFEKAAAQHRRD